MEVSGELHTPTALPPRKKPRYSLYGRLGMPQRRSGGYGKQRDLLLLSGINPGLIGQPARSDTVEFGKW
jgi:hypothetical protein